MFQYRGAPRSRVLWFKRVHVRITLVDYAPKLWGEGGWGAPAPRAPPSYATAVTLARTLTIAQCFHCSNIQLIT